MEVVVLVEEVDSEGEGIMPSTWNQSKFVGKKIDVPMESLAETDQSWVPVVNEVFLRRVRKSVPYKRLLLQQGISPVTNAESLEALVGLVG